MGKWNGKPDLSDSATAQQVITELETRSENEIKILEIEDRRADVDFDRRERLADRKDLRRIRKILRKTQVSGTRAKAIHDVWSSAEARSLRLWTYRRWALAILLSIGGVLVGMSTPGVREGILEVFGRENGAINFMSWGAELALAGLVAFVIVSRAILDSSGGKLDNRSYIIEFGALFTSIGLNMIGAWPEDLSVFESVAYALGHSFAALGVAGVAFLISMVESGVAEAEPWKLKDGKDAPRLRDIKMDGVSMEEISRNAVRLSELAEAPAPVETVVEAVEAVEAAPVPELVEAPAPVETVVEAPAPVETVVEETAQVVEAPAPVVEVKVETAQAEATAPVDVEIVDAAEPMEESVPAEDELEKATRPSKVPAPRKPKAKPEVKLEMPVALQIKAGTPRPKGSSPTDRIPMVLETLLRAKAAGRDFRYGVIAEATGVPRGTVGRYVKAYKDGEMDLPEVAKLEAELGVTVAD